MQVFMLIDFKATVDSLYLEQPLSRTSLYLQLKSQSLCVTYFSLSISTLSISNEFSSFLRVRDRESQLYNQNKADLKVGEAWDLMNLSGLS